MRLGSPAFAQGTDRNHGWEGRGTTEILGVAIMIGMVTIGAISIFFVGGMTLERTSDTAETQRVEYAFAELGASVDSVALGNGGSEAVDFDLQRNRGAIHQTGAGRIVVSANGTEIANRTFGAIEYRSDGTVYAYQAGGVWRGTGASSEVLAAPMFDYGDGTLNLPIPVVSGERELASGRVTLEKHDTVTDITTVDYVEGDLVTVTITSDYYAGWAEFLHEQTNDAAVSVDAANETVTVKLGRPVATGNFSQAVFATGGSGGNVTVDADGAAGVDGPVRATGTVVEADTDSITGPVDSGVESSMAELDLAIETKLDGASDDGSIAVVDPLNQTLDGGQTYLVESDVVVGAGERIDVDLSAGNVTLLVDGSTTLDGGDLDVSGATGDEVLRVYTSGDLALQNASAGVVGDSRHLQVYGTSEMDVAITGQNGSGSTFSGTIYAPRDEDAPGDNDAAAAVGAVSDCGGYDVCLVNEHGSFEGAILGGSTYVGDGTTVEYGAGLATVEPTLQLEDGLFPPPITYLHVSIHEVVVDDGEEE
ncbi:DUF7289 family protein [Haloarchaeobius sp. DFWS5]|uniref:DUF7289 family protein n=1 Tax=Haloarchaeobius sp. DFWS5 TaxID=3446114 RepID=UPI003EBD6F32